MQFGSAISTKGCRPKYVDDFDGMLVKYFNGTVEYKIGRSVAWQYVTEIRLDKNHEHYDR